METSKPVPGEYLGPTVLGPDRLGDIGALADSVFRCGRPNVMATTYPLLFNPDRMDQLRVFTFNDKPVALVGVLIRDLLLGGCEVRAALLGSVCTDEAHRGKGLADHLLTDAINHARRQGATLMIISGGLGLYLRRGARTTGHLIEVMFPADAIEPPAALVCEPVDAGNAGAALRMIESEPVRYRWSPTAFGTTIESRHASNERGQVFLIRPGAGGEPVAFIAIQTSRPNAPADGKLMVIEFAGSRNAVLAAAAILARRHHQQTVRLIAQPGDPHMAELIAARNLAKRAISLDATVKILDIEGLWRSILPLLRERVGDVADHVELHGEWVNDNLTALRMSLGGESVTIGDEQAIVDLLFGQAPLAAWNGAPPKLAASLKPAFPLPLPAYGLSYV